MNAIEFLLTTLSPVLVTKPGGGDPNSEVTLPYIPGSAIRGMIIAQWLTDHPGIDAAVDPTFRRLFLDGTVRFLNAYPALINGARMLPTPLSWRVEKDSNGKTITDFAFGHSVDATGKPQPTWQPPKVDFCVFFPGKDEESGEGGRVTAQMCSPQQSIAIHTARANRQNVTRDATVFRYDALAAGQTFASAVIADDPEDLVICQRLLSQMRQARLGRSQNTGYGHVQISYPLDENGQPQTAPRQNWREWMPSNAEAEEDVETEETKQTPAHLIVTLLSDAILRHPQTGAETDDITVAIDPPDEPKTKPTSAFVRTNIVGGFNRHWNLPLPQATAISAGSVFVFGYDEKLQHRLERLVEEGIGERRAEGFGRIAVNWQVGDQIERSDAARWSIQSDDIALAGETAVAAQQLAMRILRNRLDEKLLGVINSNTIQRNGLHKAQLSRLRVITQRGLAENNGATGESTKIPVLTNYLNELKKPARDQLLKARIVGAPLLNWLRSLADDPSSVVNQLKDGDPTVTVGGQTATFTETMQIEYALRLLDGILLLAAKQAEEAD
jgi:CRISPR-associated protein Csx10